MSSTGMHDQILKFTHYRSLNLTDKIYQLKTLQLLDKLKLPKHPTILDLGGADGSFLKLVSQKLGGLGKSLDLTHGDNLEENFNISDNYADLVIAQEIIEHLFDTDHFLSEVHRVLKPGGILIISTPNLASLKNRLRLLVGKYPQYLEYSAAGAGHIHIYTPDILCKQIDKFRFSISKLTSPNFPCPWITKSWFPNSLKNVFMTLGDLFPSIGSHLLVIANK